jgi:hypothetical protein
MDTPEKAASFLANLGYSDANIGRALESEFCTNASDAERIVGEAQRNAAVRRANDQAVAKADRRAIAAEHKEE